VLCFLNTCWFFKFCKQNLVCIYKSYKNVRHVNSTIWQIMFCGLYFNQNHVKCILWYIISLLIFQIFQQICKHPRWCCVCSSPTVFFPCKAFKSESYKHLPIWRTFKSASVKESWNIIYTNDTLIIYHSWWMLNFRFTYLALFWPHTKDLV